MGQYHYTVNLDKNEYIDPHKLGDGLKLLEQCGYIPGGTNDALHLLLAVSSGRGGGDFHTGSTLIGRWGGDRIAVVGDYAEDGDLDECHNASSIYFRCGEPDEGVDPNLPQYRDITDELIPVIEAEYEVLIAGDGWRQRVELRKAFNGWTYSHMRSERVADIAGSTYLLRELVEEARARMTSGERPPLDVRDTKPI